MRWHYLAVVVLCAHAETACARAFEVRLLSGSEQDGVWGTDEYAVRVNSYGAIRGLKVAGREVVWLAALYTSPLVPGGKKGLRVVQGEGVGERGLSIKPPSRETWDRGGVRVFRFRHELAKPAIAGGRALCQVAQTIALTPTGEISVVYDLEWVHTCRWSGFGVLMFFTADTVRGCEYMGLRDDRVFAGKLLPRPSDPLSARLREPLDQLTLRTPVGPVHLVWDSLPALHFTWAKGIQLSIRPARAPYRGTIDKGTTDRIAYRILLPVSQQ